MIGVVVVAAVDVDAVVFVDAVGAAAGEFERLATSSSHH